MAATDSKLGVLALIALTAIVAGALITLSHELSRERIAENQRERLLAALHEVLDPASYDNDLEASRRLVSSPELLGSEAPVEAFVATRAGEPVAAILAPVAPRGYNGPIELLVGVKVDGTITGVRVTRHRETPGLGDAVEADRSDWIEAFRGTSLRAPPIAQWSVSKDGGEFDSITGATVTPRAIVAAVRDALIYVRDNGDALFAPQPSELEHAGQ